MENYNEKLKDLIILFSKVVYKFNKLQEVPYSFDENEKLYLAEIHIIQAIGRKEEETVTGLSSSFGITKGAISQIVGKLTQKGYLIKKRDPTNGKVVFLSLSEKGLLIFKKHEILHDETDKELCEFLGGISEDEIVLLERVFHGIGEYIDAALATITPGKFENKPTGKKI
jgi:DNA-binding MarR family transcriptional regulator